MELSRNALVTLSLAGFALAGAGWFTAWQYSKKATEATQALAGQSIIYKASSRDNARSSIARKSSSDPRTAKLLAELDQLNEDAEPGKPNPKYLKAVESVLNDSLYHRRQRNFRLILEKLRPEDAAALHEQFREMEKRGLYFPDYAAFASRWGEVDGQGAMNYFKNEGLEKLTDGHMTDILTGWGSKSPEEALEWITSNKEDFGDKNPYRGLLVGWLNSDLIAATTWLQHQDLTQRQTHECVTSGVLDIIHSQGIEAASEWVAALPSDDPAMFEAAQIGWATHVMRQQRLDPAIAAASWVKVANEPWMRSELFGQFLNSVSASSPEATESFVELLSRQWGSAQVSEQFTRWAAEDPEGTANLIQRMPPSALRDTASAAVGTPLGN